MVILPDGCTRTSSDLPGTGQTIPPPYLDSASSVAGKNRLEGVETTTTPLKASTSLAADMQLEFCVDVAFASLSAKALPKRRASRKVHGLPDTRGARSL